MFIKYIATRHFPEIILKITIKVDKTVYGKYSFTNCEGKLLSHTHFITKKSKLRSFCKEAITFPWQHMFSCTNNLRVS